MRLHRVLVVLACSALAFGAVACSDDDSAPGDPSQDAPPRETPSSETPSSQTSSPEPTPQHDADSGPLRLAPVPVGEAQDLGVGLLASVTRVELVDISGEGPGATSGPGLAVDIEFTNTTDAAIDLAAIVVNATGPDGEVGIPATAEASSPAIGSLEPGAGVDATYLFRVDGERVGAVIDVGYGGADHVVVIQT